MVRQHHLHTHEGRIALPGHLPRPILSQDSRMASAPRINENLTIDALDNAVNGENPEEGLMVHMDRGSQYTSSRFCRELENRGFVQSFSRKGCPYDNAVMESFFKTLKRELPLDLKYNTRIGARQEIFKFIELHCNTRRPYSSLDNLSPMEYKRQCAHWLDSGCP